MTMRYSKGQESQLTHFVEEMERFLRLRFSRDCVGLPYAGNVNNITQLHDRTFEGQNTKAGNILAV